MSAGQYARSNPGVTAVVGLVVVVLVAAFWSPALFDHKTHFIGDAIGHSLPLLDVHARALNGSSSLLWSDLIFGGHPLFAEGQGAFAHPLNMLFAWLVPPLYGASLFHCIGMLLAAWGAYGLCRCLGASVGAAGFGSLVAVFSSAAIGTHHNMTIGGAAVWLPWVLWSMEAWFKQPTVPRAVLWCIACCLCILAGYPHLFHGAVIYMALSLLFRLCFASERACLRQWRRYAATGVLAVMLCAGIAAIQLLPLFELAGESHRSGGTGMLPTLPSARIDLLRGLLFSATPDLQPQTAIVHFVGSLLMAFAALLVMVVPTSARVKGHVVATLVLLLLGMGTASPFFIVVYEWDLLPGLRYFRWALPYLVVTTTGLAVLSAAGIDGLVEVLRRFRFGQARVRMALICALVVVVALLAWQIFQPGLSRWSSVFALAALVLVSMLAAIGRQAWVPLMLFLLLVPEIFLQHGRDFPFADVGLLARPESGVRMAVQDDMRLYRAAALPGMLLLYPLVDPRTPDLPQFTSAARSLHSQLTGLMYDVASFGGALALPLRRRALLESQIEREMKGDHDVAPPGLRLIDLLSLRYVASETVRDLPGFAVSFHDARSNWWFLQNQSAKPRIQTYTRVRAVNTPEDAVQALTHLAQDELIVEMPVGTTLDVHADGANEPAAIRWNLRSANAIRYEIEVDADRDGWLFLADANYPGWQASVDGRPVEVFSAQVLGKAVAITPGHHTVEISFHSASFRHGAMITITSLFAALIFVVRACRRANLIESM